MYRPAKIISGGQTGVDRAALRAARDCQIPIGGWCPPGRACDHGVIPAEFPLSETPLDRSGDAPHLPRSQRTEWNVRDADATLVLCPQAQPAGEGTRWTISCAQRLGRPLLVCDPAGADAAAQIRAWLATHQPAVLNVAGPCESQAPGIGELTYALLQSLLAERP